MTLLDVLLVLAAVVVVPLTLPLVREGTDARPWIAAGALTAPSLLLERGSPAAVILALPWLALAASPSSN